MKEYEIVAKFYNACGGAAHPQTRFEEAELNHPDEYIRKKHERDFQKFTVEFVNEQIVYTFDTGGVKYVYEFTELS